jgi:hypothetical protein
MKRTWTIIGVGDVPGSFKWYQALFGQPATLPAHDYFRQILDSDGTVLLCLHVWGAHELERGDIITINFSENGTTAAPGHRLLRTLR